MTCPESRTTLPRHRPRARPDVEAPTPFHRLRSVRTEVEKVIEVIRPAIQADNGDVLLHDVDEATGVVTVELIGACVSCPASTVTLKAGLERILMDRVPGVTEVIDAGAARHEVGSEPGSATRESPAASAAADAARAGGGSGEVRETPVSL